MSRCAILRVAAARRAPTSCCGALRVAAARASSAVSVSSATTDATAAATMSKAGASQTWQQWCETPLSALIADNTIANTPNFISKTATVAAAASQMVAMSKSYLMVVDSNAQTTYMPLHERPLLGIATERALLAHAVNDLHAPIESFVSTMKGRCSSDTSPLPQALCASPSDTVGQCLRLMHEKIYRHLPVLDADDQPLAILNIRDLLKPLQPIAAGPQHVGVLDDGVGDRPDAAWWDAMLKAADADAARPAAGGVEAQIARLRTEASLAAIEGEAADGKFPFLARDPPVGEILNAKRASLGVSDEATRKTYLRTRSKLHTVGAATSAADARLQLVRNRLTFLIVVDDKWQVKGIASERHFLAHVAGGQPRQAVWELMTPIDEMIAVQSDHNASRCMALMLRHNIRHLPVLTKASTDALPTRPAKLEGILSLHDLLAPLTSMQPVDSPWGLSFAYEEQH